MEFDSTRGCPGQFTQEAKWVGSGGVLRGELSKKRLGQFTGNARRRSTPSTGLITGLGRGYLATLALGLYILRVSRSASRKLPLLIRLHTPQLRGAVPRYIE